MLDKRAVDSQGEGVEIQAEHFEPCQGEAPPGLELGLQGPDEPRHDALRERRGLKQRRQRPEEPAGVGPGQVGRDDHAMRAEESPEDAAEAVPNCRVWRRTTPNCALSRRPEVTRAAIRPVNESG